jgi:hypothetical protein
MDSPRPFAILPDDWSPDSTEPSPSNHDGNCPEEPLMAWRGIRPWTEDEENTIYDAQPDEDKDEEKDKDEDETEEEDKDEADDDLEDDDDFDDDDDFEDDDLDDDDEAEGDALDDDDEDDTDEDE